MDDKIKTTLHEINWALSGLQAEDELKNLGFERISYGNRGGGRMKSIDESISITNRIYIGAAVRDLIGDKLFVDIHLSRLNKQVALVFGDKGMFMVNSSTISDKSTVGMVKNIVGARPHVEDIGNGTFILTRKGGL